MRYGVFLRAMNVGANRLPVAALRERMTAMGFTDVATHLQTGNVALTVPGRRSAESVAEAVEADLREAGMARMDAMVRTPAELRAVLGAVNLDPYPAEEWRRCVTFLRRPPGRDATERMAAKDWTVLHADDRTIVSVYPRSQQGYALNLDTAWKTSTTTRWVEVVRDFLEVLG